MTDLSPKAEELFFVIQKLRQRGASQREALRAIRAQGRSIGDTAFRRAYNRGKDTEERARKLRTSRRNFKPKIESIPLVPTAQGSLIRARFSYQVELTGTNVSGEPVRPGENIITIVSNDIQDRATIEKRAIDLMTQDDTGPISGSDQMQRKGVKARLVGISQREIRNREKFAA